MDITFGDDDLVGFLVNEKFIKKSAKSCPGLIICRGFPPTESEDMKKGHSYRALGKYLASDLDWPVLIFNYRGAGGSPGNFSMQGWLKDVNEATDYLAPLVSKVWIAGFGIGGSLAICVGAKRKEISGVIAAGAPADFSDWSANADQLLEHSRNIGLISDPDFPADQTAWGKELTSLEVEKHSRELGGKPLLVIHGTDDAIVPSLETRAIADGHGNADIRIMEGVTHRLAVDPRVSAIISGWLYRQASEI